LNSKQGDIQSKYNYSLYWAVMTITHIGSGDIVARNNREAVFACFTMLSSVFLLIRMA